VVVFLLVKNPVIQTWLVKQVTATVSEKLNAQFSVRAVNYQFFNKVELSGIYIEDQQDDTLLYVPRALGNLSYFSRKNRIVEFSKVYLEEPMVRFRIDSNNIINLKFITEQLRRNDTTGQPLTLKFSGIELENGVFTLENAIRKPNKAPIDFGDLHLENLYINLNDFSTRPGGVYFKIKNLSFVEKSGFGLRNLQSEMDIFRTHLKFENIHLLTDLSEIEAKMVELEFDNFQEFKNFSNKVRMDIEIMRSNILMQDAGSFTGIFENMQQYVRYSGHVTGTVSSLHGRDISFDLGEDSRWNGHFDLTGLPEIEETFGFIEMESQNILPGIFSILQESTKNDSITLPKEYEKFGEVQYNGLVTGFYNDFVSYGEFQTELGNFYTDLSLELDSLESVQLEGKLEARDFRLGAFLENEDLYGNLTMNLDINGTLLKDNTVDSELKGLINSIELYGYEYENIQLDGWLDKRSFNGSVIIKDPHLDLDFLGMIDLTGEIPEFDFTLNVPFAHLHDLNLVPNDSTAEISLLMTANFIGNNIDDMNGAIKLLNSKLTYRGETLEAYDFSLEANNRPDSSWIQLRTDYLNARISGQYEFNKLWPSIQYVQYKLLPATLNTPPDTSGIHQNNFRFQLIFSDLDKPSRMFFPNIDPGSNLTLYGWFRPTLHDVFLEAQSDYLLVNEILLNNPQLRIDPEPPGYLSMTLASNGIRLNPELDFDEFSLRTRVGHDSLKFSVHWFETDSMDYRGDLDFLALFQRNPGTNTLTSRVKIPGRKFIHNDDTWSLAPGEIFIDSTAFHFMNLELSSNEKMLGLDGIVSKDPQDTLLFRARNLRMNNLRVLNNQLSFAGLIDGNARFSDLYNNPMILSNLNFENVEINDEPLGNGSFTSVWDPLDKAIRFETKMQYGNLTPLSAMGRLSTTNQTLDLDLRTEKLRLKMFQPFIRSLSSELNGLLTSQVRIEGPLKAPRINGDIELQKLGMRVDYLNTKFTFSDRLIIDNNVLNINQIEIFDSLGHKAIASGRVDFRNFNEVGLNLQFNADNLMMLDLREWQNDIFYGQVYGTGLISLKGTTRDLKIDIAARAVDNTKFYLPLHRGSSGGDLSFVSFTTDQNEDEELRPDPTRNPSRNDIKKSRLELNINLEPTPQAEITLFFDPTAGGSLSARGSGELKMNVQPESDFNISGEYTIDQGTYNFVLSQVVNKKFEVRGGSKISWNGEPTDAILDVVAVYKLRTSLYNLFYDEAYRRRIPVDCEIYLTGPIESPEIRFNIDLPTADEDTKTRLRNSINTEEDMTKQFLSLLIVNSFMPDPNYAPAGSSGFMSNPVEVTTAEVLSNQLSNWVSQISNDFDIGFHYRPGDEVSRQEIEVALSTQILNDRVIINSNIDVGGGNYGVTENTNDIAGDFSVEVKIDKRGKFRVKAFTRPNDKLIYESSPYTSGIGIFFREEFNSFGVLIKGYWNKIFGKKDKKEDADKELANSR
jgi:hypothetical protein